MTRPWLLPALCVLAVAIGCGVTVVALRGEKPSSAFDAPILSFMADQRFCWAKGEFWEARIAKNQDGSVERVTCYDADRPSRRGQ